jgi:hypothetical protein
VINRLSAQFQATPPTTPATPATSEFSNRLLKGPPRQPLNLHHHAINQVMPPVPRPAPNSGGEALEPKESWEDRHDTIPWMQKQINLAQASYHKWRDRTGDHDTAMFNAAREAAADWNRTGEGNAFLKAQGDMVRNTIKHPKVAALLKRTYEQQPPDDTFTDW